MSAILVLALILFGSAIYYVHRHGRLKYQNGLARQSRDSVAEEDTEFNRLLKTRGIDSPATQEALRALIRAQVDMRDSHPDVDCEKAIAALIKLVKK